MFRQLKGIILLVLFFQQTHGQNIPDSSARHVATIADRISWIIPGLTTGGQLLLDTSNLNHQVSGDTLTMDVPTGLHQGGLLRWEAPNGQVVKLGALLLKFRFYPGVGSNGHWVSPNTGNTDTITAGMTHGWRALEWPRVAGNQPPVNAWGTNNQWILSDTTLWLIEDTIGGNEIAGPDSMRIRFIGSKEATIKNGARCFIEVFPSAPFTLFNSRYGSLRIESTFPIQFNRNKLELSNSIRIQAPKTYFPDSVISTTSSNLEWVNLGDSLFISHLIITGGGTRKLTGNWVVGKSLQTDAATWATGSLLWAGDSSGVLVGNYQLDRLILLPNRYLKLTSPIRLNKSNQASMSQLQLMNRSILESDTSGFIWEGSHLGYGNVSLENKVSLRLKSLSLRKLWPSGSRLKVLHPGDLQLTYSAATQGLLEWPDSASRNLGKLTIGDSSRWELGASFSTTQIDSVVVGKDATLELPDGRYIQLSPQAVLYCDGTIECQDNEGLVGSQSGSIRALSQQIQLTDTSKIIYNGGSQKISPLPYYPQLTLGNTGVKTLEQGIVIKGSLSIQGTNTRLDADTCTLVIGKDFVVNTTSGNGFSEGQSTLVFTNPQARFVTTGFQNTETVYKLEVKAGARLLLQNNLSVKSGGGLLLETGAVLDADTMDLTGGGTLRLLAGSHLILKKTQVLLPGLSGNSSSYQIDSAATIELAGQGNQILRGGRRYGRLVFSNQGIKQISTTLSQPPFAIEVKTGASLHTQEFRYAGSNTHLKLDSLATLKIGGFMLQPEAGGNWQVHPQAVICFNPAYSLPVNLRAGRSYPNLLIERGDITLKENDSISIMTGSSYLQIDSGASLRMGDSSRISLPTSGFSININGYLECRHQAGLFGQPTSSFGATAYPISGKSTLAFTRSSGMQLIDSLVFHHLILNGNSVKSLANRLEVRGDLSVSGGSYRLPDSLVLSGLDSQKVQIQRINHVILSNSVKLLTGRPQLFGDLIIRSGARLTNQLRTDTLIIQQSGRVWTDDNNAISFPMSWIYRHPIPGQGWRLAGFPLSFPLSRFATRYNFTDTINPTIRGINVHHGVPSWVSLSQKTPTITWNDTLFTPFTEAWMIKCGPSGLLRTTTDSVRLIGHQLPAVKAINDSVIGWRCISNPFLQELNLMDSSRNTSTGLKQAIWRWGGLQYPGWQLYSSNMLLVDSALNTDLTQLAPAQSALVYRHSPGQTLLKSASDRGSTSNAPAFRSTQLVQHDIELNIRFGSRLRQKVGVKTISGTQADTLPMPPFPEGEKEVIGWFNPGTLAQGLVLPELTSNITIPLYARAWKNDTLIIDFNIKQLASGWEVFLYDSLTQQFHLPGQTYVKRIPFWVGQRLALHLVKIPVSVTSNSEEPIYRLNGHHLTLTESADWLRLYNLQGQLIEVRNKPESSESVQLPSGFPTIIHIKKGEKQWVNTVFRP